MSHLRAHQRVQPSAYDIKGVRFNGATFWGPVASVLTQPELVGLVPSRVYVDAPAFFITNDDGTPKTFDAPYSALMDGALYNMRLVAWTC